MNVARTLCCASIAAYTHHHPAALPHLHWLQTLGQVLVINAPVFFDSTYAVAKVMLSAETQAKIQASCYSVGEG